MSARPQQSSLPPEAEFYRARIKQEEALAASPNASPRERRVACINAKRLREELALVLASSGGQQ